MAKSKVWDVEYKRIDSKNKLWKETIQADANNCTSAKKKVKSFFNKIGGQAVRVGKCKLTKRQKPQYLRI